MEVLDVLKFEVLMLTRLLDPSESKVKSLSANMQL